MFHMIAGASVSDASLIKEEYCVNGKWITANISAENIPEVFRTFFEYEENYLFCLWIEAPSLMSDEEIEVAATETEPGILKSTHRDVYYLDDLSREAAQKFFELFEEILINDGMSNFGFVSQRGNEVGRYKYNVMNAYSDGGNTDGLKSIFDRLKIPERDTIKTAWDYIDPDHPGVSEKYELEDGRDIYDVIDVLKEIGMYLEERRED